jgi:hypothetical protein
MRRMYLAIATLITAVPVGSLACPTGMKLIAGAGGPYCIDQYEASVGAGGYATSVAGVTPRVNVSQVAAEIACLGAGKRLCTDAEWLRACRGPDDFVYPYGNTLQPGACNDNTGVIAATGAFSACVTAEGVNDMVGNVGEWTADPNGTFRGGFFNDAVINGPGCLYVTTVHSTSFSDGRTGFRCCSDDVDVTPDPTPTPMTPSVPVASGMGLLALCVLLGSVGAASSLSNRHRRRS